MRLCRVLAGCAVTGATLTVAATPALAHDCLNPTKDAHAPTAGVNYTITGFDPATGPVFEQTGAGKGIGGFVAIAPHVFGPEQTETLRFLTRRAFAKNTRRQSSWLIRLASALAGDASRINAGVSAVPDDLRYSGRSCRC